MKFWLATLTVIAALAAWGGKIDRDRARHDRELECEGLVAEGAPWRWARELGVQYDSLAVTCAMPWGEDLAGGCWLLQGDDGERLAHIWIDPQTEDYDLELVLIHEMVHLADKTVGRDRPDDDVHAEAVRRWRAGRPWERGS